MSTIPEDLLVDILVRLPVDSLLRFRCVAKSWLALIDRKEFICLHLKASASVSPPRDKFIWSAQIPVDSNSANTKFWYKFFASDFDSPEKMRSTLAELPHPFPLCPKPSRSNFHGSCNGLLCLSDSDFNVILWNPCINKHWKLPYSPVKKVELGQPMSELRKRFYHSFGYDDTRDDYKVVRVVKLFGQDNAALHQEIEVYGLNSNSWKTLQLPPHFPYFIKLGGCRTGFLANHAVHWIMADRLHSADFSRNSDSDVIVALDLRTEKYHLVPPPENISTQTRWDLGILDGCLCVLSGFGSDIYFWIMKDYGEKDSWTKVKLHLPVPSCERWVRWIRWVSPSLYPVAYSKRTAEILFMNELGFLWYNTEKQSFQKASFPRQVKDPSIIHHSSYPYPALGRGYHFLCSLVKPCGGTETGGGSRKRGMKRAREDLSCKMMDTRTTALRRCSRIE